MSREIWKVIVATAYSSAILAITLFDLIHWLITGEIILNVMFDISAGLASAGVVISSLMGLKTLLE